MAPVCLLNILPCACITFSKKIFNGNISHIQNSGIFLKKIESFDSTGPQSVVTAVDCS